MIEDVPLELQKIARDADEEMRELIGDNEAWLRKWQVIYALACSPFNRQWGKKDGGVSGVGEAGGVGEAVGDEEPRGMGQEV